MGEVELLKEKFLADREDCDAVVGRGEDGGDIEGV